MTLFNTPKQYIFTLVFGLLVSTASAGKPVSVYFTGIWDGNMVQINNPKLSNKNKYCIKVLFVNGKKIKTDYKIGGVEFDPAAFGFKEGQDLKIELKAMSDCEPTFHSEGFTRQK